MKAIHIILLFGTVATVSAHDLVGRELVHYELTNYVFAAEHDELTDSALESYFKNSDYTRKGFFRELVYLSECLKHDQSSKALLVRDRIMGRMARFSKEDTQNYLQNVILTESGHLVWSAIGNYLRTCGFSNHSTAFLSAQMRSNRKNEYRFHADVLSWYSHALQFVELSKEQRSSLIETLKDLAKDEVMVAERLDKILCREIPDYAASAERAATLKRVAESPEASDFMRGYMREELRKLGKPVKAPPKKEDK